MITLNLFTNNSSINNLINDLNKVKPGRYCDFGLKRIDGVIECLIDSDLLTENEKETYMQIAREYYRFISSGDTPETVIDTFASILNQATLEQLQSIPTYGKLQPITEEEFNKFGGSSKAYHYIYALLDYSINCVIKNILRKHKDDILWTYY